MKLSRQTRIIVVVALCLFLLWSVLHVVLHSNVIVQPYGIAHRGGAGLAPENTLAAISEAISKGIQIVEIDIQRTSDNVLVLMHNRKVERTTKGSGYVNEMTWEVVSQLDAGSHFSERFAGEGIPTLHSVLEEIVGNDVILFLEVKNTSIYPGIEGQIHEAIDKYKATEHVVILSFDHKWLKLLQETGPDLQIGCLCLWKGNIPQKPAAAYLGVHWMAIVLDPTVIKRAHDAGQEVFVWTVNLPLHMRIMHWLGADGVMTDRPDIWLKAIGSNYYSAIDKGRIICLN